MILAIDTGNTHTVIGILNEKNEVLKNIRIPTDRDDTLYVYAAKMKQVLEIEQVDLTKVEGAIISSVVPQVTAPIKGAIKLITGADAIVLGNDAITDLEKDIVGGVIAPDLEATAVAAKECYPLPSIIIDLGTANTITVVNEKGVYVGGVIYPGVGTSLNALIDKTSLLPAIELVPPSKAIANETVDAMKAGVVYGASGAVDGIIDHFEAEMEIKPASIVATGGLGGLICQYCRHDIMCDDELLLKGLGIIYQKTVNA